MNEMNLPENPLHSWQPRRPSAKLKNRIFAMSRAARVPRTVVWSLRCLAPAAACLVLGAAMLNQGGTMSNAAPRSDFMLGMIGSNQLAYSSASFEQQENRARPVTFEWTNRSGSTSLTPFTH